MGSQRISSLAKRNMEGADIHADREVRLCAQLLSLDRGDALYHARLTWQSHVVRAEHDSNTVA